VSLDLDKRQRAMLREMGVRVWPTAPTEVAPVSVDLAPAVQEGAAVAVTQEATRAEPAPLRMAPVADSKPAFLPEVAPSPGLSALPEGIERMDWPGLQAAVAACRACALCESRQNTVFGIGPTAPAAVVPQVDWLIVGEAPGENEDLAGEPFVGPAGQLLDNMLLAMKLRRGGSAPGDIGAGSVYITNVLKCRPPANRNPELTEMAQCEPYLRRQVALLQPKMILALGKFAAQSLLHESVPGLQKIPLGKLRGQVYHYQGVPVVVSYHPAYLLRSLADKAKAWDDLCLAMGVMQGGASSPV
jgi:uracil-DNA glycosylase family 4